MKEWNELLQYVDEYVYLKDEHRIIIKHGPNASKAQGVYDNVINSFVELLKQDGYSDEETDEEIFEIDIAIDCVRKMSDEDKNFATKHMDSSYYHTGYAMGIRNKYIWDSKYSYKADSISVGVMSKIFAILCPTYDLTDGRCTQFYGDKNVWKLQELYQDSYEDIFADTLSDLLNDEEGDVDKAIEALKRKLKMALGPNEFMRILKESMEEYDNYEKKPNENWFWKTNFCNEKAVLYQREATQMNYKFPNLPDYRFPADWLTSFLGRPRGRLGLGSA